jgi:NADH dehydrogenase FAD-containing subunit
MVLYPTDVAVAFLHPEPLLQSGWRYLQAEATAIDFAAKSVACTLSEQVFSEDRSLDMTYDKLVVGIGAVPNTSVSFSLVQSCSVSFIVQAHNSSLRM